ncbi:MAG: VOC family protein [Solirubrobacterales bacterium]|nr:VOC family protein [Solirubrobacterales bacterium]
MMRLDFVGIPSRDADRARSFYRDAPGLRPDEHARYEQWAGDACFGIWEPEKVGMPFVAQKGNPWALGCDDVRPHWQSKGYE